jgi:hypothetical protein
MRLSRKNRCGSIIKYSGPSLSAVQSDTRVTLLKIEDLSSFHQVRRE